MSFVIIFKTSTDHKFYSFIDLGYRNRPRQITTECKLSSIRSSIESKTRTIRISSKWHHLYSRCWPRRLRKSFSGKIESIKSTSYIHLLKFRLMFHQLSGQSTQSSSWRRIYDGCCKNVERRFLGRCSERFRERSLYAKWVWTPSHCSSSRSLCHRKTDVSIVWVHVKRRS